MSLLNPPDPPSKNKPEYVQYQKDWVKNWVEHPEFKKRLANNLNTANDNKNPLVKDYFPFNNKDDFFKEKAERIQKQGLAHLENTKTYIGKPKDNEDVKKDYLENTGYMIGMPKNEKELDQFNGMHTAVRIPVINKQYDSSVFLNNNGDQSGTELMNTAIHEFTHATNIDEAVRGAISKPKNPNENLDKNYRKYIEGTTEVLPRIMAIRYSGGIKPGEKIDMEKLKNIKAGMENEELFKAYSDEEILDMLNTLAVIDKKRQEGLLG